MEKLTGTTIVGSSIKIAVNLVLGADTNTGATIVTHLVMVYSTVPGNHAVRNIDMKDLMKTGIWTISMINMINTQSNLLQHYLGLLLHDMSINLLFCFELLSI